MDNTIVNVALPSIGRDLHASLSGLQWTVDAYTLVIASLLLLAGSTGDRLGRRRTFQAGLVRLRGRLAALQPRPHPRLADRRPHGPGVGGSMLNPVAMSIITNVFTDPRERARAIGAWGATVGISLALGPIVGGAAGRGRRTGGRSSGSTSRSRSRRSCSTALYVPESRAARPRRLDPVGQVLVIVTLATLTYAIIDAPKAGWISAQTVALFVLSASSLAFLVAYELRRREPLIELRFFRSAPFSGATHDRGAAPSRASAASCSSTPSTCRRCGATRRSRPASARCRWRVLAGCSRRSPGGIVGRRGRAPRRSLFGGICMMVAPLLLTRLSATTPLGLLLVAYAIFGVGFGAVNPPITYTAVSGMPDSQAGVAAAVASTSRQVGQTLGVAAIGSIVGTAAGAAGHGLAGASHPAWWVIAACGAAVLAIGAASTGARAHRAAKRAAAAIAAEAAPA